MKRQKETWKMNTTLQSLNSTFTLPWFSLHGGENSDKLQGRTWSVCFWRKLPWEADIYNRLLWLEALPLGRVLASQDHRLSSPVGSGADEPLLPTSYGLSCRCPEDQEVSVGPPDHPLTGNWSLGFSKEKRIRGCLFILSREDVENDCVSSRGWSGIDGT